MSRRGTSTRGRAEVNSMADSTSKAEKPNWKCEMCGIILPEWVGCYILDGRKACPYCNVAWCRPFTNIG